MHVVDRVEELGIATDRFRHVDRLMRDWCGSGKIPSAGLVVGRGRKLSKTMVWGSERVAVDSAPIRDDAIFLIASITKPIVAMGALLLVERGELALDDRVENYLPEFGRPGKHATTLRHLLTHTSGLPDMLPNNADLRGANAPLSAFAAGACEVEVDFPPGRGVQYQSMGFAILGEIIARVSGRSCAKFLEEEFFAKLGMRDTALGAPDDWFGGPLSRVNRIAELRLTEEQARATHWNWNSRYWRQLGVPWGGLLTTPADLGRFAAMLLGWELPEIPPILSRSSIEAATRNQLEAMREVPADDRRCRPWGLGWRLNWAAHSANFGDLLGPQTYGHWGATGTVMWIDPGRDAFCVLLTTQPQEPGGQFLARISNVVAASFI